MDVGGDDLALLKVPDTGKQARTLNACTDRYTDSQTAAFSACFTVSLLDPGIHSHTL